MEAEFFSLRMRSSLGDKHISGAERLLEFAQLEEAASTMLKRALNHPRGQAERIFLTLQPVEIEKVQIKQLLSMTTYAVESWQEGRLCAGQLLENLGLKAGVIQQAMAQLAAGPSPSGGAMRGAMLICGETGSRLEPEQARGVRVSRMDLAPEARKEVRSYLSKLGLDNPRVIEAWTLASKVALYPQIMAELCWSDDPDYLTGYVASGLKGYQRITHLKEAGSEIGGRIFFVRPETDLSPLIDQLQHEPVLFAAPLSGFP
jgi:6-carboxyhexanoate--CoA ligase